MPFLALALLREAGGSRRSCVTRARQLAGRPWGVGILGFVPPELRAEQLAVVREFRPPFALFAGGRPDQAAGLEREGIATYLARPLAGLARAVSPRRLSPLRARGTRMRRARGPEVQLRPLGTGGRRGGRGTRPRHCRRPGEPRLRRRDSRRALGGTGGRSRRSAGRPRRQGGNPGRNRLSVHTRSRRDRGDRAAVPG